MRSALWLVAIAAVGAGLGYGLRPVLAPARGVSAETSTAGETRRANGPLGNADNANGAGRRYLPPPAPPRARGQPLVPVRPDGDGRDPTALVPREVLLREPDGGAATNFTARRLATAVLMRLVATDDDVSLRACLERSHPEMPGALRVEMTVRSSADQVELRGVRLIEPAPTAADEACLNARLAATMTEPRHESLPPLLAHEGTIVEAISVPAD